MTNQEAHELLNAAKAGVWFSQLKITQALMATGDFSPGKRTIQEVAEVTHAVPTFEPRPVEPMPEKNKRPPFVLVLPKLIHKPWCNA